MEITLGLVLPRDELSIPIARHICRDALNEVGVAPDCTSDIEIALTEACTNVIEHAYRLRPAMFEFRAEQSGDGLTFTVIDGGQWEQPRRNFRGRGLPIMRAAMDSVDVNTGESGTKVVMRRRLSGRAGSSRPRS